MASVPNSSLEIAQKEEVMTYDAGTQQYSCGVCKVQLSGSPNVESHLAGARHREAAARYALAHIRTAPNSLLGILGLEERIAAASGTIELVGTKEIKCVICLVTLTGLVPLRTHLISEAHKKKINVMPSKQMLISETDSIAAYLPIVPRCEAFSAISSPSYDPEVLSYDNDLKLYSCHVCEMSMLPSVDIEPHLAGAKHREAGARYALAHIRNASSSLLGLLGCEEYISAINGTIEVTDTKGIKCVICQVTLSGIAPLRTHLASEAHKKKIDVPSSKQIVIPEKDSIAGRHDAYPSISFPICEAEISSSDNGLKRYSCSVCEMSMLQSVDIESHLAGAKHKEAAARYALAHIDTAPDSLLELLGSEERNEAVSGTIEVTDTKEIKCLVCLVVLSGIGPLRDHLVSDAHKKKIDMAPSKQMVIPAESKATATSSYLGTLRVPLWFKLSENEEGTSNLGGASSKLGQPGALLETDPRLSCATAEEDNVLNKAFKEKTVIHSDDLAGKYHCCSCEKKFNSTQSLTDHLISKKHKTKAAEYDIKKRFDNPDADEQSIITLERPVMRMMQPAQPIRTLSSEEKAKQPYSVISTPRGHVYVFNYAFKNNEKLRRNGAEKDSENIKEAFCKMGYDVFLLENMTGKKTLEAFKNIRSNSELNSVDVLVIFILSHGIDPYTFMAEDGEEMHLLKIRFSFSDRQCPCMRGKPKLFFTNYCRGDQMQARETDAKDVPNDMVTIHAAVEGVMAMRLKKAGTIFVKSLCKVLNRYAHKMELREIYRMLDDVMKEDRGTKPMWEDYGFRNFNFIPISKD